MAGRSSNQDTEIGNGESRQDMPDMRGRSLIMPAGRTGQPISGGRPPVAAAWMPQLQGRSQVLISRHCQFCLVGWRTFGLASE